MCLYRNEMLPRELAKLRKRTRPFAAWKVLDGRGRAYSFFYQYGPGEHRPGAQRGAQTPQWLNGRRELHGGVFHCYRYKRGAYYSGLRVWVHPDDLVAVTSTQLACTRLRIRESDWRAAGFKFRPRRRR